MMAGIMRITLVILTFASVLSHGATVKLGEGKSVSFRREVMPVLQKQGCSGGKCHGSFSGRGGLRLSLFASMPELDFEGLVLQGKSRRVNSAAPDQSLMLLKPTASVPHQGGRMIEKGSEAYRILRRWISEGVHGPKNDEGRVVRLEISPSELVLKAGGKSAIRVVAHWSDGMEQDVTDWAGYEIREERIATVNGTGGVSALHPGRTSMKVQYLGVVEAVPVSVPYGNDPVGVDFAAKNFIDEMLMAEWAKMGLKPAPVSDDHEFVRRAYLDVIGTLPTSKEVRAFVASQKPTKRDDLIDALLERPEYVDFWTMKWGDLLRVHRRFVGEKGMWSFHGWLQQAIRENRPVDRIAQQLLTAKGDLYANGAVAYFYTDAKPEQLAETTAQVFLGVRMQCARCHDHPLETWKQTDYFGLANYFARLTKKDNADGGRFGGAKLIKTSLTPTKEMRPKMRMDPRPFDSGQSPAADLTDIRQHLAQWITATDNPYFARNWVNRYWSYLMGRGLIEPVDDLRGSNPPLIPTLMAALEKDFVADGHDLKKLIRRICTSRVYQLASVVSPRRDEEGKFYTFRRYRMMPAQVLLDAIDQATGLAEEYPGMPAGTRAIQLPDPSVRSDALTLFGRSLRANPCECAASSNPDLARALHLLNSESLQKKITHAKSRLGALLKEEQKDRVVIDELYLSTLSRPPSDTEWQRVRAELDRAPSREEGFQDLLWALLNSAAFVYQH